MFFVNTCCLNIPSAGPRNILRRNLFDFSFRICSDGQKDSNAIKQERNDWLKVRRVAMTSLFGNGYTSTFSTIMV